jgi:hypothetical protein
MRQKRIYATVDMRKSGLYQGSSHTNSDEFAMYRRKAPGVGELKSGQQTRGDKRVTISAIKGVFRPEFALDLVGLSCRVSVETPNCLLDL